MRISGEFGFSLGISFQLRDDLLDYSGKEFETGKEIGKDFLEGKVTLPLIKALQLAKTNELKLLILLDNRVQLMPFKRKQKNIMIRACIY